MMAAKYVNPTAVALLPVPRFLLLRALRANTDERRTLQHHADGRDLGLNADLARYVPRSSADRGPLPASVGADGASATSRCPSWQTGTVTLSATRHGTARRDTGWPLAAPAVIEETGGEDQGQVRRDRRAIELQPREAGETVRPAGRVG